MGLSNIEILLQKYLTEDTLRHFLKEMYLKTDLFKNNFFDTCEIIRSENLNLQ